MLQNQNLRVFVIDFGRMKGHFFVYYISKFCQAGKSFFCLSYDYFLPGWRIMPEDDSLNLKMNKDILNQVLERIK